MTQLPRIFGGIAAGLHHLSGKQRVIAGNIANSDTAGYKALTVEEPDFAGLVDGAGSQRIARPTVAPTTAMAELGADVRTGARVIEDHNISETKPDGNTVTLEDQLLQMGQLQADYATLTSLYAKQLKLLKTALGRSGS